MKYRLKGIIVCGIISIIAEIPIMGLMDDKTIIQQIGFAFMIFGVLGMGVFLGLPNDHKEPEHFNPEA